MGRILNERIEAMSFEDLDTYITCKEYWYKWQGKSILMGHSTSMAKTAKDIIANCPGKAIETCRIMLNKDIPNRDTKYFKAELKQLLEQQFSAVPA